jgi:hypothetical protein
MKVNIQSGSFSDFLLTSNRPARVKKANANITVAVAITAGCKVGGSTKFGRRPSGDSPACTRHKSTPGYISCIIARGFNAIYSKRKELMVNVKAKNEVWNYLMG